MNTFIQDLRFGSRVLIKNPGFTVVALLVLTLAIGGTAAMFTIVNGLVLRPIYAKNPEALVRFFAKENKPRGAYRGFSYPNFQDIKAQSDAFTDVAAFAEAMVGVNEGELTRRTFAMLVSANYFSTFGVPLAAGRPFLPEEERPGSAVSVVIVSDTYWKNTGSDPHLLGKTVRLNARPFRVIGILRPEFTGTTVLFASEFILPLGMYESVVNDFLNDRKQKLDDRGHHCLRLIGTIKPGLTREAAQARVQALAARLAEAYPDANKDYTIELRPPSRISMNTYPQEETGLRTTSVLLLSLAGAVLLIACLNLANMLLARGASRHREIAVRLAMGGGRFRIICQLLTEGLLLAGLGGVGGLVLASWASKLLVTSLAAKINFCPVVFDTHPDWRILLATCAVCLLSVLFFGLGPALRLSRVNVSGELKEQVGEELQAHKGFFGLRNVLVVGQLALSLVMLTAAGLFARGAFAALKSNPGFSFDQEILVETDASMSDFGEARGRQVYLEVLQRLRGLPGVDAASLAYVVPFGILSDGRDVMRAGSSAQKDADGKPILEKTTYANLNVVGTDYFKTLRIPLLRGREFHNLEMNPGGSSHVVVVDEALAAEMFKQEPALGHHIQLKGNDEQLEIVGIVGNIKDEVSAVRPTPHVYLPFGLEYRSGMNFHVRTVGQGTSSEASVLRSLRETIRAVDPNLAIISVQTLRHFHEEGPVLWFMKAAAGIFATFGALALLLAVIGIYGVKSYVVTRRTREIGIRMALGASPRAVLWMILKQGLRLTAVGLGLGLLLSVGVSFALRSFLYGLSPIDPVTFVTAPLCLATATLLACLLPARRAMQIQPMAALRYE